MDRSIGARIRIAGCPFARNGLVRRTANAEPFVSLRKETAGFPTCEAFAGSRRPTNILRAGNEHDPLGIRRPADCGQLVHTNATVAGPQTVGRCLSAKAARGVLQRRLPWSANAELRTHIFRTKISQRAHTGARRLGVWTSPAAPSLGVEDPSLTTPARCSAVPAAAGVPGGTAPPRSLTRSNRFRLRTYRPLARSPV